MEQDVVFLKNGDTEVFSKVFYEYSEQLYNYFYLKTGSEYHANEVVQLTFIKLWKFRGNLKEEIKLSAQIFQIAKSTMIDEIRKDTRNKNNLQHLKINYNLFTGSVVYYDVMEEKDSVINLNRIIEKLPPVRKMVFLMSKEEQLSQKEISSKLNISIKTVNKHMQLALKQIRPLISTLKLITILTTAIYYFY